MGISENHVKGNREACADQEHFQHDIVERAYEHFPKTLRLDGVAEVASKVLTSLDKVAFGESVANVRFQLLNESIESCRFTSVRS